MRNYQMGGVEHTIDCNAYTPYVYSEEFLTEGKNGHMRGEDINECVVRVTEILDASGVPPMLDMLRLLWAFEKTTTPKLPRFKAWLKSLPPETLALDLENEGSWATAVIEQLNETFFPSQAKADVATVD